MIYDPHENSIHCFIDSVNIILLLKLMHMYMMIQTYWKNSCQKYSKPFIILMLLLAAFVGVAQVLVGVAHGGYMEREYSREKINFKE